ncbi:hypothetical protein [Stutzerimonas stutzeri]|uniref:Uncharacterized protein n=1 Tax=Stutzerimonas stutzeri KOS6 TaxID=1218352 RepID=A0A061JTH8_STUST|nr:hypothetical protein [Stutzerimonas stutzeri]EWC41913.1 hypothetical protein B597_007670 [Stutzerimonas stutzeri KOS6]
MALDHRGWRRWAVARADALSTMAMDVSSLPSRVGRIGYAVAHPRAGCASLRRAIAEAFRYQESNRHIGKFGLDI